MATECHPKQMHRYESDTIPMAFLMIVLAPLFRTLVGLFDAEEDPKWWTIAAPPKF